MSRPGLGANYWKLWTASTISNLGDGVTLVAGPLLAASLTRDPVLVAGVAFAQRLPWLLFSLISGALVDRLDRRLLMGMVDIFRAVLVGFLGVAVLLGFASIPLMYVVFFLLGIAETLFDNASQAILPSVVARDSLEKANGRLFGGQVVTNQFAGPPVGGFLFALAASVPFLIDAGTFAAAAALVLVMRGRFRSERTEDDAKKTIMLDIREGLRWLFGHRLLRMVALMLGFANLTFAAFDAIFVLFVQNILGLGSFGFGVLLAAGAIGGVAGSMVADRIVLWLGSGTSLHAVLLTNAAALAVIAVTENPFIVGAMIALVGVGVVVWNVITVSFRQAIVPKRLFGRVNSVYRLLGWGGISLGALIGGLLAGSFGLRAPFVFGVLVLVAMSLLTLRLVNNRTMYAARQ